eukprot:m.79123 g.79123  ORF g.79123 m.79123 type:complete len:156 (+) comp36125_c0_seq3:1408-1875(+)
MASQWRISDQRAFVLGDVISSSVDFRTVELKVQGGTPYESGVELDPSLAKTAGGGKLPSLLRGRRTPKLYVKLQYLRRNVLEVCNTLPDVLVTPVSYLPFLSYARCTMADELLRDRHDEQDAAPICSPTLSLFLQTVDYPDIMDVLRVIYCAFSY